MKTRRLEELAVFRHHVQEALSPIEGYLERLRHDLQTAHDQLSIIHILQYASMRTCLVRRPAARAS